MLRYYIGVIGFLVLKGVGVIQSNFSRGTNQSTNYRCNLYLPTVVWNLD
jgi:hypothetical protein